MLTAVALSLVLAPPQISSVGKENYVGFFKECQRREAYLEAPATRTKKEPQFLGLITDSKFESKGLSNTYGDYGSTYSKKSIWNAYSDFGSKYSDRSPWNAHAQTPVEILSRKNGQTYILGYLGDNEYARVAERRLPIISPRFLAYWLDRGGDIPK